MKLAPLLQRMAALGVEVGPLLQRMAALGVEVGDGVVSLTHQTPAIGDRDHPGARATKRLDTALLEERIK